MSTPSLSLQRFGYVRVAAVTPELRIADVPFNVAEIRRCFRSAEAGGAQVVLFPELSVSAYSCSDLFYQTTLLGATEDGLAELCRESESVDSVLIVGAPLHSRGQLYNCAVVIAKGHILGVVPKTFLPNYNEFYESRWFASDRDRVEDTIMVCGNSVPFGANLLFEQQHSSASTATSFCFGVEICEDLWATKSPSTDMSLTGAQVIFNLSASNEVLGKAEYRRDLVRMQSARCIGAYVYCSAGSHESSTDVVFAGHTLICENGMILQESERFRFDSQITMADVDVEALENDRFRNSTFRSEISAQDFHHVSVVLNDRSVDTIRRPHQAHPFVPASDKRRSERCAEIFALQCTALEKRLRFTRCTQLVIGISGGLDSTLALLVCVHTFRKMSLDLHGIHAISMPGFGTSTRTRNYAQLLAEELKVDFREISIRETTLSHFHDIGHDPSVHNVVYENAQARERTQVLMDVANQNGAFVIGTGDLSEIALGWSTFNGDHMSMYAVNSGIPKTLVNTLVRWQAAEHASNSLQSLLLEICEQPISPELLPLDEDGISTQSTEESIGPYELHDFYLYAMLRHHYPPHKILLLAQQAFEGRYEDDTLRHWLHVFYQRFFANQFKRNSMPDGPKVGSVALSPRGDWRMPSDAQMNLWVREVEKTG